MRHSFLLTIAIAGAHGQYTLLDDYTSDGNFFDRWHFYNNASDGPDPTNGITNYVDNATALANGYATRQNNGSYYLGLDYTNVTTLAKGRDALRLESLQYYTEGLFVLDVAHMPGGICGTWPSFWLYGGDGPAPAPSGEMDIIEQANDAKRNEMTMHVFDESSSCDMKEQNAEQFGINAERLQCHDNAAGSLGGCAIDDTRNNSFGVDFNSGGGGVYAARWTDTNLTIWFWSRNEIPTNSGGPLSKEPLPSTDWGKPSALFQGTCDFRKHFAKTKIIINTALCGDWAGTYWKDSQTCSSLAPTCNDYVLNTPEAFKDAYWLINSLKVYQPPSSTGQTETGAVANVTNIATSKSTSSSTGETGKGGGVPALQHNCGMIAAISALILSLGFFCFL